MGEVDGLGLVEEWRLGGNMLTIAKQIIEAVEKDHHPDTGTYAISFRALRFICKYRLGGDGKRFKYGLCNILGNKTPLGCWSTCCPFLTSDFNMPNEIK